MQIKQSGITIIESLVGLSILSFIIVFIFYTMNLYFTASAMLLRDTKATYLAEEGQEFARFMRDSNWTTFSGLSTTTTYYFAVTSSSISATTTPQVIDSLYTRSFTLQFTKRNGSNDLVESGGSNDSSGRVATVNVVWGAESVQLKSVLENLN